MKSAPENVDGYGVRSTSRKRKSVTRSVTEHRQIEHLRLQAAFVFLSIRYQETLEKIFNKGKKEMNIITKSQIKHPDYLSWLNQVEDYLKNQWGINEELAERISLLLMYGSLYNIAFNITSGFRDPKYQQELLERWNAGNRTGLKVKPAVNSKHSMTTWLNNPDSHAIDLWASDLDTLGSWAPFFGLKWGGNFNTPDKVHFYI